MVFNSGLFDMSVAFIKILVFFKIKVNIDIILTIYVITIKNSHRLWRNTTSKVDICDKNTIKINLRWTTLIEDYQRILIVL